MNKINLFLSAIPGRAWGLIVSLLALTFLGLTALWFDSTVPSLGTHWIFQRQAIFFALALLAGTFTVMAGWRRILKATPWIALSWLILVVLSLRHGLFLRFGAVKINTLMWTPLIAALTLAWGVEKFAASRNMKWLLMIVGIGVGLAGVVTISNMTTNTSRDEVEVLVRQQSESACRDAMREARWFASVDGTQEYLPGSYSENMPAACAVRFGHFFNVLAIFLWAAFAYATVCCFHKASSLGKKMFIAVACGTTLAWAVYGYGMCFGIFPFTLNIRVPLVSYGGIIIFLGHVAGMVVSLSRDDDKPAKAP